MCPLHFKYVRKKGGIMKITFNLYGGGGLISRNTLSAEDFAEFRKLAESLRQSVRIEQVES